MSQRMTDERFDKLDGFANNVSKGWPSELSAEARRARAREAQLEAEVERVNNAMAGVASSHARLRKENESLSAENKALREVAEAFASTVEAAVAEAERRASGKKGMQVPFHGDFASAIQIPSAVQQLRWWADRFRAALRTREGT